MIQGDLTEFWRQRCETALNRFLPSEQQAPERLHTAIRYACMGGGKRLRAQLVYASGAMFDATLDALDYGASAIEMIHAYSLVHDDLPAMDNDDLRRGKPTVHKAFDEATAILVGDALQSLAFDTIARTPIDEREVIRLCTTLAQASGSLGMCGGQQLDMDATGKTLDIVSLQQLHSMKTGALIRAAIRIGAITGGTNEDTLSKLDAFAIYLGIAFQIRDDILDSQGDTETLGKTAGKDAAQEKSTYVTLLGLQGAQKRLDELNTQMQNALMSFGTRADALRAIADFAVSRDH
jgi:farnesyl diphosphate synthase